MTTLTTIPGYELHGISGDRGVPPLPGDKSISHRSILLSALANGESVIDNFLLAGVTRPLLKALNDLGILWRLDGNTLVVQGGGIHGWQAPAKTLDCSNSGTTLRLLAGALATANIPATMDGTSGLRQRPMSRILEPLQAMGVPISASIGGVAPLVLGKRSDGELLRAIDYRLPVASAQVKSCLLLAALTANGVTTLREPGPSRDHTERLLQSMGVTVDTEQPFHADCGPVVRLTPPDGGLRPLSLVIPGDPSSAAFLIVAALITPGSDIVLRGVCLNPTRTGLIEVLHRMGGQIDVLATCEQGGEPVGDLRVRYSALRGVQVSGSVVVRMIDEFPIFAIAAVYADGETWVGDAEELRYKESDRINALCQELAALGAQIEPLPDGFVIRGRRPLCGGHTHARGDHRLAMSLAVAGLAAQQPVIVTGAETIGESYPSFIDTLRAIGAHMDLSD